MALSSLVRSLLLQNGPLTLTTLARTRERHDPGAFEQLLAMSAQQVSAV